MRRLLHRLERFVWPRGVHCLGCGYASQGELLCPTCARELERLKISVPVSERHSVWLHKGIARKLVLDLKYNCVGPCSSVLAQGMTMRIREMELPPDTVLTWVAMPKRRRGERGIDHGRLLCEAISEQTGMEVRSLLKRKGKTVHTQQGLSGAERQRNLMGTFYCDEKLTVPVLLIDDVLTTGATSSTCREILLAQGAPQVWALTATWAAPHLK